MSNIPDLNDPLQIPPAPAPVPPVVVPAPAHEAGAAGRDAGHNLPGNGGAGGGASGLLANSRVWIAIALIGVGIWVAVNPSLVYAKAPRGVLFFLLSILPALLFAGEIQAQFKFELAGFIATGGGMFASCIIILFVLDHITKEDLRVRGYYVVAEDGVTKVPLMGQDVLEVGGDGSGRTGNAYPRGNEVLVIFPEELAQASITVSSGGHNYTGVLDSGVIRRSPLVLGKDLH